MQQSAGKMAMAYRPEVQEEMPQKRVQLSGMADTGPKTRTGMQPRHPVERLLLDSTRRSEEQEMMA